jgi:HAD superfamily hydrolase (TIGR01490 family)
LPPEPKQPAAFFDLDGTLLAVNSGRLWMDRERRAGRLTRGQLLKGIYYLLLYRFGLIEMERAMTKALSTIKGLPEQTVRQWTREWFVTEVVPWVARGAQPVVEDHRARGHPVILLTSSSPYESEIATEHFRLDAFLSTRYEVESGLFTGRLVPPVCYGPGKVELAERFAAERGIDLAKSFFYSDSITDRPMLERVGNPRVVNPDLRLRRLATGRGWPILDWTR